MSLPKRAGKNIGFKILGEFFNRVITFFFYLFIARFLGDQVFGTFSFADSFVGLFVFLIDFGINSVLIRDVSRDREKLSFYYIRLTPLKLGLALATWLLLTVTILSFKQDPYLIGVVILMGGVRVLTVLLEYHWALFNAIEQMEYEALLKIVNRCLIVVFGVASLLAGAKLLGLASAMLVAYVISLLFGFFLLGRILHIFRMEIDWDFWKQIARQALPLAPSILFWIAYYRVSIVQLSILSGDDAVVGWFSVSLKILDTLIVIPFLIVGGVFPIFSDLYANLRDSLKKAAQKSFQYLLILAVPITVGTVVLAEPIIRLLFGPGYLPAVPALQILMLAMVFVFLNFISFYLLVSMDLQWRTLVSSLVGLGCLVGLNQMMIPPFGYLGAGWVMVISTGAMFLLNYLLLPADLSPLLSKATVFRVLVSGAIMGSGVYLLREENLWVVVSGGAVLYFLLLLVMREFKEEDRRLIAFRRSI